MVRVMGLVHMAEVVAVAVRWYTETIFPLRRATPIQYLLALVAKTHTSVLPEFYELMAALAVFAVQMGALAVLAVLLQVLLKQVVEMAARVVELLVHTQLPSEPLAVEQVDTLVTAAMV